MHLLPAPLLTLLFLSLTSAASPSPAFLSSSDNHSISLVPRHTLFYRQLKDLQSFSGSLGGVRASSIMNSGIPDRPFQVEGSNFPDFATAAMRSCDEQFDGCQKMANSKGGGGGGGVSAQAKGGANGNGNANANGNGGGNGAKQGDGGKAKGGKARAAPRDDAAAAAGKLTVNMCDDQKSTCSSVPTMQRAYRMGYFADSCVEDKCKQTQQTASVKDFTPVASENIGPDPAFPDFDLICEG